jgi:hypothetical protein
MKSLLTKTLLSSLVLFIIISFLILNIKSKKEIQNIENEEEIQNTINGNQNKNVTKLNKTYLYIYDVVVIMFILLMVFFIFFNGFYKGCIKSLFVWSFFILCTPVPEAGLLISLPLKRYFGFKMELSQIVVSLFACMIIFYFYCVEQKIIKNNLIGNLFLGLINYKYYSIIFISVISSVLTSNLLDNIINHFINKDEINYLYLKMGIIFVLLLIYIYLLNNLLNFMNKKK